MGRRKGDTMRFKVLLIFLLGLSILPSSAQIPGNKLFAYSEGDIWTWFENGAPEQITDWGYNGGPILAPDERYIAYLSVSTEAVAEINAGGAYPFPGTPPANIWLMDTATQLAERIAEQDAYPTLRGTPAWSPRGRELTWVEFDLSAQNPVAQLVIYDMDTRQTQILSDDVNLGFQDGGYYIHPVQWGSIGISRMYFTFVENGQLQTILELYDVETGNRQDFIIQVTGGMTDGQTPTPIDYFWVEHEARSMIAILMSNGEWRLLNPLDGSMNLLTQTPNLVNRNGNAQLVPVYAQTPTSWEIQWFAINETDFSELPFVTTTVTAETPALSPDGLSVAWNANGDLSMMHIGDTEATLFLDSSGDFPSVQPASIVWSSMHWVTMGDVGEAIAIPGLSSGDACGLASRLSIGDTVTVTEGEPNNIRAEARLDSPVIAQFAPNEIAEVIDGPVCIDGFRWWYVSNEDFAGWTAEGNATEYWLVPVQG
jgi:hypothetical protein